MPGRGQGKGKGRVGKDLGRPDDAGGAGQARAGDDGDSNDGGFGEATQGGGPGRSEWSPGHMKRDAGAQSARDFAPGHGGKAPGQVGRDRTENAVERPESDSFEREG